VGVECGVSASLEGGTNSITQRRLLRAALRAGCSDYSKRAILPEGVQADRQTIGAEGAQAGH